MQRRDQDPKTFERHFWLTRSVARMVDVDLGAAMAQGRITADAYLEMVAACRAGGCAVACQAWLARQPGAAATPPPFCRHKTLLARLS